MMVNLKYLYLLVDCLTICFPLAFSFYPKAMFSGRWKAMLLAILIPGTLFLIWDEWFTQLGVWGFNERYLTGIRLGSLPLEEVLFFVCIPYACVFMYAALKKQIRTDHMAFSQKSISLFLIIGSALLGLMYTDRWYTCTAFLGLAVCLSFLQFALKVNFLGRFYFSYVVILIPFLIVNGILTGSFLDEPVVWYNNAENLGIRIGTIPVEDAFYGMLLIGMNVSIFEFVERYDSATSRGYSPF